MAAIRRCERDEPRTSPTEVRATRAIVIGFGLVYSCNVPELSRFLGIVIAMFVIAMFDREHGPPHYHAIYAEYEVTIEIESGLVSGNFPRRALNLVLEWHNLHKSELTDNWERARDRRPLKKIPPLE